MPISESTIRKDVFKELFTLINANKLSGWTVLASFPEVSPTFPCIIINPANIDFTILSLTGTTRLKTISIIVDIFSLAKDGKAKMDEGKDNVSNTLWSNITSLFNSTSLNLIDINDSNVETIVLDDQKINFGSMEVLLTYGQS